MPARYRFISSLYFYLTNQKFLLKVIVNYE